MKHWVVFAAVAVCFLVVVTVAPLLLIWCINVLFGVGTAYGLEERCAALLVLFLIGVFAISSK